MVKKIIKNKIIISIFLVSIILLAALFVTIPMLTKKNTIDLITQNSENTVEQIKLFRQYYVQNVVGDVKGFASEQLKFDYDHKGVNGVLPFPTSTIHDLSQIFSENTDVALYFYSDFPFSPKKERILSDKQQEILKYMRENESGIYVATDTIDGKPVVRVAVSDYMTDQSCVDCHNSHKDRTWDRDWQLGDKRGVLEVVTSLEDAYAANDILKYKILTFIGGAFVILILYYSFVLYKRETELLDQNEILDQKVRDEVAKNLQKEKQIILQNRSAALGDMMAAIIHQWKQPLNGISMANSSLKLQSELGMLDSAEVVKQAEMIDIQITNMNDTMNDFRDFFKPKSQSCYDLNESILQVMRIVGKIYEVQKITLRLELEDKIYTSGYSNEFNQVIINILNNARDVILERDAICKDIIIKTFKMNDKVIVTIEDFAGGIPEEIIDTIFEPYVTTKDEAHGTGIGLDMSKNIIEKVGGTIEAKNQTTTIDGVERRGAIFTITLHQCGESSCLL